MALSTKMIINEASNQEGNRRADGLYTDLLDIEKFIRINNLQEVTNPIYLNKMYLLQMVYCHMKSLALLRNPENKRWLILIYMDIICIPLQH